MYKLSIFALLLLFSSCQNSFDVEKKLIEDHRFYELMKLSAFHNDTRKLLVDSGFSSTEADDLLTKDFNKLASLFVELEGDYDHLVDQSQLIFDTNFDYYWEKYLKTPLKTSFDPSSLKVTYTANLRTNNIPDGPCAGNCGDVYEVTRATSCQQGVLIMYTDCIVNTGGAAWCTTSKENSMNTCCKTNCPI